MRAPYTFHISDRRACYDSWLKNGWALLSGGSTAVPAGVTAQLSGTIAAGSYCVSVFDIGNQSAPVTYAVTITHF